MLFICVSLLCYVCLVLIVCCVVYDSVCNRFAFLFGCLGGFVDVDFAFVGLMVLSTIGSLVMLPVGVVD